MPPEALITRRLRFLPVRRWDRETFLSQDVAAVRTTRTSSTLRSPPPPLVVLARSLNPLLNVPVTPLAAGLVIWNTQPRMRTTSRPVLLLAILLAIRVESCGAARVGVKPNREQPVNASSPSTVDAEVPEVPEVLGVPEVPEVRGVPEVSEVPEVPSEGAQASANASSPEEPKTSPPASASESESASASAPPATVTTPPQGENSVFPVSLGSEERKRTKRAGAESGEGAGGGGYPDGMGEGAANGAELQCEAVGPCMLCDEEEIDASYCTATGRREEVIFPVRPRIPRRPLEIYRETASARGAGGVVVPRLSTS